MHLPDRSTVMGGLSGLVAWGIGIGLTALGVTIPPAVITGVVAVIIPLVVHFVPDAAKVDAEIKTIGSELPITYSNPTDYPLPLPNLTSNNINQG